MEPPDKGRGQRLPGSHSRVDQTKEQQADRDGGLFDTILQLLCCKEAPVPLTTLTQLVGAGMSSSDQQNLGERIKNKVLEFPNLFDLDVLGDNVVVTLQCDLRLCQAYCSKTGCSNGNCDALHLCKHFVISGKCTFEDETKGKRCSRGHDPTTDHNAAVLWVRMLSSLSIHQIRVLLKVTDDGIARASVGRRSTPHAGLSMEKSSGAPNQGQGNPKNMDPHRGPGNPMGRNPNRGPGNPMGMSLSQEPGNHMGMGPNQGPGNYMTTLEIPELCLFYISRGCRFGDKCKSLHVCKYYLYGNCSFGKECKRSHNILDDQPKRVLQESGINVARKPKDILAELRPRLPSMHVKDQDDQPSSSSADRRRTDSDGSSNQDGLDLDSPDLKICQYFLRGTCSFKGRCKNLHRKTQFQWQYRANGAWEDFCAKSNTEIELTFCDVSKDCCCTEIAADPGSSKKSSAKVDFEAALVTTLSGVKFPVHRVTTESAVKLPPGHKFVTRWLWFWQDDDDTWKQYGKNGESLSSDDIEEHFLEDENSNITFETALFNYMIQFRPRMVQMNRKTDKARTIRRRPEELYTGSETSSTQNRSSRQTKSEVREKQEGKSEIQKKEDSKTETSESQPAVNIPPHWDMDGQGDNDFFKLTTLEKTGVTCFEYKKIERLFAATMGSTPIKEIQRIQNLDLWESYCWKKGRMERDLPAGQLVTELQLFHGTRKEFVDAICQQGFDFRYCGRSVGTLYGRGSYFAVKASYSKNYTDSRCLFIAKVLVGASSQGNAALVRPPAKDPSTPNKLFDSCVDNVSDASIYVVFSNEQAYPEYKITY